MFIIARLAVAANLCSEPPARDQVREIRQEHFKQRLEQLLKQRLEQQVLKQRYELAEQFGIGDSLVGAAVFRGLEQSESIQNTVSQSDPTLVERFRILLRLERLGLR
jgi:hypothetical protein